jgi:uncharacterized protein GlcG (DUF336 family)
MTLPGKGRRALDYRSHSSVRRPHAGLFQLYPRRPSLLAGIPKLARVAAYGGGVPIKVDGEIVWAIGLSGAPTVQNDIDCARAALALVSDAVPVD